MLSFSVAALPKHVCWHNIGVSLASLCHLGLWVPKSWYLRQVQAKGRICHCLEGDGEMPRKAGLGAPSGRWGDTALRGDQARSQRRQARKLSTHLLSRKRPSLTRPQLLPLLLLEARKGSPFPAGRVTGAAPGGPLMAGQIVLGPALAGRSVVSRVSLSRAEGKMTRLHPPAGGSDFLLPSPPVASGVPRLRPLGT